MTAIRKRRWILAIVAIVLVVGVVASSMISAVLRNDPKDVPRLVMLRQEQENGQKVVVFRFDAPKHKAAGLGKVRMQNPFTGTETEIKVLGRSFEPVVRAGESDEIRVVPPVDDVWRLRCEVHVEDTRMDHVVVWRMRRCWGRNSFFPLWEKTFHQRVTLESELITNGVPPTADAPPP